MSHFLQDSIFRARNSMSFLIGLTNIFYIICVIGQALRWYMSFSPCRCFTCSKAIRNISDNFCVPWHWILCCFFNWFWVRFNKSREAPICQTLHNRLIFWSIITRSIHRAWCFRSTLRRIIVIVLIIRMTENTWILNITLNQLGRIDDILRNNAYRLGWYEFFLARCISDGCFV